MTTAQHAGGGAPAGDSRGQPRVVFYDPVSWQIPWSFDVERAIFAERGVALVEPRDAAEADVAVRDADIVVVAGLRNLDAAAIATLGNCAGILCYSVGMNQVDQVAAAAAGIPVSNVPFCVDEVSDHALTLLLAAERRLILMADSAGSGNWDVVANPEYLRIRRLRGQTLGIIGAGRIGKLVARKARAFGFRTLAHDPYLTDTGDPELPLLPLNEVLGAADAVVTCASLTSTSRGIMNEAAFAALKPGAILVNIARGGLIDEPALAAAMRDGRVAVAALDVRSPEPPIPDNDALAGLPNLILTPHVAGASVEAREDLHTGAAKESLEMLAAAGRISAA
jgi:D-3-phosphoglycerate dehydrogenase / 2-oxoglutarate reductase